MTKHRYPEKRKPPRPHSVRAHERGGWSGAAQGEAFDRMHNSQEKQFNKATEPFEDMKVVKQFEDVIPAQDRIFKAKKTKLGKPW